MIANKPTSGTSANEAETLADNDEMPSESPAPPEVCPHCRQGTLYAVRYESYDQWRKIFKLKPHFCTHCDARVYRR